MKKPINRLFGGGRVLGNGLGALRHGVLGQLTGEDEADGSLDLSGRDGGLLVVGSKLGGLGGNALEDVWIEVRKSRVPTRRGEIKTYR